MNIGEAEKFIETVAQQKPEKPDFWSSCSQCERNTDTAQDILEQPRSTRDRRIAEGWIPLDEKLPDVQQWVLILLDRDEDSVGKVLLKYPRWTVRHAWVQRHAEEDGVKYAEFSWLQLCAYGSGIDDTYVKYWMPFPKPPDEPYSDLTA